MTLQDARERVAKGASHLDQVKPGWASLIDTGILDLSGCDTCILGQIYGDYCRGLNAVGWNSQAIGTTANHEPEKTRDGDWILLKDAWIEAIADRVVTAQSVIAAISACNAERRQVSVQTCVCLPMAQVPAWCLSVEKPFDPREQDVSYMKGIR